MKSPNKELNLRAAEVPITSSTIPVEAEVGENPDILDSQEAAPVHESIPIKESAKIVRSGKLTDVVMLGRQRDVGARFVVFDNGVVIVSLADKSHQIVFRQQIDFENEYGKVGTIVYDDGLDPETVLMASTIVEPI